MRKFHVFMLMRRIGAWAGVGKRCALASIFFLCSLFSVAEDFVPVDGTNYMIRCMKAGGKKFVLFNDECYNDDEVKILSTWLNYDLRSFFLVSGNATDGYTIRNAQNNFYVFAVNTADANSNVGLKEQTGETVEADCLWKIVKNGNGWNIIPKEGENGWNCRGNLRGNGCVGQWESNGTDDNRWQILSPADMGVLMESEKASVIGFPVFSDEIRASIITAGNVLNENLTQENLDAFKNAVNSPSDNHLYLPTGYYQMKSVASARREYLYNDCQLTANTHNLTLQSEAPGTLTNNYVWHVTNNGTSINLINGQGSFIKPSAANGAGETYPTLNFGNYIDGKQGIYFTEKINCSNGSPFLLSDGTHHLTTWADGGANHDDNRWLFDAVDETKIYTLAVEGITEPTISNTYISITTNSSTEEGSTEEISTTQFASNGGFFFLETSPSVSDFTVPDVENYSKSVTVVGNTITVTYAMKIGGHAVRVNALNQLKTGSKIVIRNDGRDAGRTGFVHESGDDLLIDNAATSLTNLTYDYVFTVSDYDSETGECYLTANSSRKIAGAYTANSGPMKTVDSPAGKITLLTEGNNHWDLKYGVNNYFNNQKSNDTQGPFVNTWTSQGDSNASWEIFLVDDEDMFRPTEGAVYYIDCVHTDKGRAVYLPGGEALGTKADADALHLGNLFTVEPVVGTYGEVYYHIKPYGNPDEFVYYMNTNDADANVGVTADANHANREWCITPSRAEGTSGFNILPKTGRNGWNCRGTESVWDTGAVGQSAEIAVPGCAWAFVPVDEDGIAAAIERYKTTVRPSILDRVGGVESSDYEAAFAELTEVKDIFMAPLTLLETLPLIKPTSASGLFRIKNRILDKYLYQEADEKNIAFINDKGGENDDANSRYFYRVTFGENNAAEIVNSNGKPLARGNQSANYANANTVVVSPVTLTFCNTENYFLFPETHSTAQNVFTKNNAAYNTDTNPYFLTTWSTTGEANQYTFEAVELPTDTHVYNVSVTGGPDDVNNDVKIIYTGEGYNGNATVYSGGFFVLASAPVKENLRVESEDYEVGSVDVNGTEVTVRLVGLSVTEEDKAHAREVLNLQGVGYPVDGSEARSTLETAIENASKKAELTAAVDAYKAVVTDIQMPEDGKAYTFTFVLKNGTRRYMDYTEAGYQLVTTTDADNGNYPMTATLVCHRLEDGTYAFVNNAGKYFMWKGSNAGHNGNKGYSDTWDGSWSPITVSKILNSDAHVTAPGGQADLFGYMAVQGHRENGNNNEMDYFVAKSTGSGNGYDQANAAFYNDNFSSAIQIEEAAYPNVVTLSDAGDIEGIETIGTFSAPFAALVPEGVTAYYVTTADGVSSEAYTAPLGAGKAIPANTGVLLTRTDGDVPTTATMIPATGEERAVINRNLLSHSAGADKTIPEEENAYILTKWKNVVGFHHLKSGGNRTLKMNKSYLVVPETAGEVASFTLKMIFGNETGINPVSAAESSQSPVYDLFGRRVLRVSKGSIYIRDGKKFIAK